MTVIDLCAGQGGFSLGLEWAGMKCVGQVEIDERCNRTLKKYWPNVPRWTDLKTLDPNELPAADLIAGGYPCQPFSNSGQRKGEKDDRHLWPFIRGIIAAKRPSWCLFENVVGHISMGLDRVLSDMEGGGYSCFTLVLPACSIGAPHQRDRTWIIANADEGGFESPLEEHGGYQQVQAERSPTENGLHFTAKGIYALPNSSVLRMDDGVPDWVERIGACGNAVNPVLVCEIGKAIMAAHYGEVA